jgi:uncharacterized protein (TIGR00251 family)
MSLPSWTEEHPEGTLLLVKVQPRASRASISGEVGGRLKVRLNSPPVEGKANKELIEIVAKRIGIPKSSVSVVKGERGREKNLLCRGIKPQKVADLLGGD